MRAIDADELKKKAFGKRGGLIHTADIDAMPTIEERKTGKWERHNTYHGDDVSGFVDPDWRCSECGGQANVNAWCMYDLTDFCPNCGARMVQEGEEHE